MYVIMYIYIYACYIYIWGTIYATPPPESARLLFVVVKYCILAFSFALVEQK